MRREQDEVVCSLGQPRDSHERGGEKKEKLKAIGGSQGGSAGEYLGCLTVGEGGG